MANFRTKARAIDLLGKNQIADLPTAITELWKNGYDAYGDYLDASLFLPGYEDVKSEVFTLSDDGCGMSKDDVLNKWFVLGTDSKRDDRKKLKEADMFGKLPRVSYGEKGIGRLSVAYLGNIMLMVTKKVNSNYCVVLMDWGLLENYELYLDEIEIPLEETDSLGNISDVFTRLKTILLTNFKNSSWKNFVDIEAKICKELDEYSFLPLAIEEYITDHFMKYGHGTVFVIFDPVRQICNLSKYDEKMTSFDAVELKEENKYIISTLAALFNPFDEKMAKQRKEILGEDINNSPALRIYSPTGEYNLMRLYEYFTQDDFDDCEHWIDGEFDELGNFTGKIKVFGKVETYTSIKRRRNYHVGKMRIKLAFWEGDKRNTSMPADKWGIYENKAEYFSGLMIYRDGVKVLPYGRVEYDFLEFEKNRSKSAGTYYFSHRKMFGFIGITKEGNPGLIDKAGREGFVANDDYLAMKRTLSDFFVRIAKDKYGRDSQNRREYLAEKKDKSAKEALLAEERNKNRQELIKINKSLADRENFLEEADSKCKSFEETFNASTYSELNSEQLGDLLQKLSIFNTEITNNKIIVPYSVSFDGFDELYDRVFDYNEHLRQDEEKVLNWLNRVGERVRDNALSIYKNNRVKELREEYDSYLFDLRQRMELSVEHIQKENTNMIAMQKEEFEKAQKEVEKSADTVSIQANVESLRRKVIDLQEKMNAYYIPLLEQLLSFSFNPNDIKILEAYRSKISELESRVDNVYLLAQVGMSVEIVNHQFNALYPQIK